MPLRISYRSIAASLSPIFIYVASRLKRALAQLGFIVTTFWKNRITSMKSFSTLYSKLFLKWQSAPTGISSSIMPYLYLSNISNIWRCFRYLFSIFNELSVWTYFNFFFFFHRMAIFFREHFF